MAECLIPSNTLINGKVVEVCPKEVVSYATIDGQTSYFDARESKIYEARRAYIKKCRDAGLIPKGDPDNLTGYEDLSCEPPECSGFFCWFESFVDGFTSGNPLRVFQSVFSVVFPLVSIPAITQSVPERFVGAVGEELEKVGLPREAYQALYEVGETAVTGGFSQIGSALQEVSEMGLSDFFSGIGDFAADFFDDFSFSDVLSVAAPVTTAVLGGGQQVPTRQVATRTATSFVPSYGSLQFGTPAYNNAPVSAEPVAFPLVGMASAAARMAAPVLAKISAYIGRRTSLNKALSLARTLGRQLGSPAAVGAALGITVSELATLITAGSHRTRRRMNPANSKALRRAARRIESFHRLCSRTDMLRSRGRRSSSRCGSCRRSPCRCK